MAPLYRNSKILNSDLDEPHALAERQKLDIESQVKAKVMIHSHLWHGVTDPGVTVVSLSYWLGALTQTAWLNSWLAQ